MKQMVFVVGLVMILGAGTGSRAFADEVHSSYPVVITKKYTNAAFSEKGLSPITPGEVLQVKEHDRDTVEVLPSEIYAWGGMVIPRTIIATGASFKKVKKWTGDSVAQVVSDGPGYQAEYEIDTSGAIRGKDNGEKGHLYRSGNIVWLKFDGVSDFNPDWRVILLVFPGERLCTPYGGCPPPDSAQ